MPRYYRFGYDKPAYAYNWKGYAQQPTHSGEIRGGLGGMSMRRRSYGGPPGGGPPGPLGDIEHSQFFQVPRDQSPYALHKAQQRSDAFFVPRSQDPYYTHKYGKMRGMGGEDNCDCHDSKLPMIVIVGLIGYCIGKR